jgi:hypothetical protein
MRGPAVAESPGKVIPRVFMSFDSVPAGGLRGEVRTSERHSRPWKE